MFNRSIVSVVLPELRTPFLPLSLSLFLSLSLSSCLLLHLLLLLLLLFSLIRCVCRRRCYGSPSSPVLPLLLYTCSFICWWLIPHYRDRSIDKRTVLGNTQCAPPGFRTFASALRRTEREREREREKEKERERERERERVLLHRPLPCRGRRRRRRCRGRRRVVFARALNPPFSSLPRLLILRFPSSLSRPLTQGRNSGLRRGGSRDSHLPRKVDITPPRRALQRYLPPSPRASSSASFASSSWVYRVHITPSPAVGMPRLSTSYTFICPRDSIREKRETGNQREKRIFRHSGGTGKPYLLSNRDRHHVRIYLSSVQQVPFRTPRHNEESTRVDDERLSDSRLLSE